MPKHSSSYFVVISVILLISFFLVLIIASAWPRTNQPTSDMPIGPESKAEIIDNGGQDPLITSARDIYYSTFDSQRDPVRGEKAAKLFILEFGDFDCAYSAMMASVAAQVVNQFRGEVSLVWKDFPNPTHLNARDAALAARCGQEQGKFWEYHDKLFANYGLLSRKMYNQIALELKLDLARFNGCLDSAKYIEIVGQGLVDGQALGADATPYLFIGNTVVDQAISAEELAGVIRQELGKL